MESLQLLYKTKKEFREIVEKSAINLFEPCFVRIYIPHLQKSEASNITVEIKDVLPNGSIIGCSTNGIIFHGKQYEERVLVILEQFDDTEVITGIVNYKGKSANEVAREIKESIDGKNIQVMHLLCGGQWTEISELVYQINYNMPDLKVSGGVAGCELGTENKPYILFDTEADDSAIVFAGYVNDKMNVFSQQNISHEAISGVYTITKAEGTHLIEIENVPATKWCFEQFGIKKLEEHKEWKQIVDNDELVKFPLILEGHNGVSRFIHYDDDVNLMSSYELKLRNNIKFRIGYVSPTRCVKECYEICTDMANEPIEQLFCYTCVFRKLYLENCAEWELKPFKNANICGAFMLGEIGWKKNKNEFFNGSCVYLGIAEKENYVKPDFSVFEDLFRVHTDNDKLVNFVLKKQSQVMTDKNQKLLDKLLDQQKKIKNQLYHDSVTNLGNSLKYSMDKKKLNFNKMCLVQIENFNLLVSRLGQDKYHDLLKRATYLVLDYMKHVVGSKDFYYYSLNDSTLFISAGPEVNQEIFEKYVNLLYDHFQTIHFDNVLDLLINRFILVYKDKDLLETGILALKDCQNLQTHYVNYNELNITDTSSLEEEERVLNILNYAITNDKVIPYFQGIYDNKERCINKYESLMRVLDKDGNVYLPNEFMKIAKKYHLYSKLSMKMIEKVLDLYKYSDFEVSINLSVYDITYKSVSDFIIAKLAEIGKCDNFVFEILEDEGFNDFNVLKDFLSKVRKFGVKIAIDDFGMGYSNFISIAQMAPDYIKIDGGIIKNIIKDDLCKKVMENIVFLGKQLEIKIVAEFVEDESIQKEIEKHDIHYSQGFYFSKPAPFLC